MKRLVIDIERVQEWGPPKRISIYFASPPTIPTSGQFTFTERGNVMTGTFGNVSPVNPAENVTSRTVLLTVAGADIGTFDLLSVQSVDFQCNDNDTCRAVVTDTNAAGSTSGDPIDAVATVTGGGGGAAPTKPTGGTFTFRP